MKMTRETTIKELQSMSLDDLIDLTENVCGKYVPDIGEGETMASQLATATVKLCYKYRNDGDEYGKIVFNDMSTYANRIENHCFPLASKENYEDNLRRLMIATIIHVDEYADQPKVSSIYKEEGKWTVEQEDDYDDEF